MNKDDLQKLNIPTLGELALHDILHFYDTPIVFVTRDVFETLYLFLLTIQTTEKTEWLVTKISKRRYLELKYNKITLKSAFTNTESSKYYLVSDHNNGETTINQYDKLPEGKITEYEYFVGENIEIIPDAYNTLENAQQTYKNTVDIISKGEFDEFGMDGKQLRDVLDSTIRFFGVYDQAPFSVKMLNGSTVLRLEFNDEYNMLDSLSSTVSLEKISNLLMLKTESDISNYLSHNIKFLEKYDNFLRNVGKNVTTLIQIASPNDTNVKKIHLNVHDIKTRRSIVKNIVETTVHEFDNEFYCFSFDTQKKKIGFAFDDGENVYADIISTDINPNQETGKSYKLKGTYKVKVVDDQISKVDFKVTFLEKKD